ncbi:Predicted DNA-binding protein, MmcQ/YjbR family [Andreprevotia lacus DSM 23236]|jgi:predicted DNA-binding protein (MmcQ/YjbR family)|uniref:Predicted DNA-binding protein, MmcQ/YjbR family n=1 Tax=Andreprevotia lacus DSM 23236 TaxID=1121001 RepID=A0A1W1XYM3_9NEIS|nr:MmcQ/YjbR family DNA-binding protein [Andreprevotia lacus]SMC28992.1 Predicted DNA-binding protein, MmcQ/YjbR family [Andreprevotia lacus DSM 23236]
MTADEFRACCAALPGATMDIKWEHNEVYSVGDKMFAMLGLISGNVGFKVDPARFLELTDLPGVRPAPYLARYHWISLAHPGVLPVADLAALVGESYALVRARLPAGVRKALPPHAA